MAEQSLNFVHQRINPTTKLVFFGLVSLSLLVLDNRFAATEQLKSYVATALYPLQWLASQPVSTVEESMMFLQQQNHLIAQNTQLHDDNARLNLHLSQQQAIIQALGGLSATNQLQNNALPNAISAKIISVGQNPLANKIVINKGKWDGVHLGDPVTDEHGLIGQISSLQPKSAQVSLITDSQTIIPAMVSRTGVRTLVYGRAGELDLRYFPADASLQPDDLLVTSGMDSVYPAGIPIAQVQTAQSGNGSPYYRVSLKPVAHSQSALFLLVIPQQSLPAALSASDSSPS